MQDMSGVIAEPASSPPMTLATDPAVEKSVTDTKENKAKSIPKTCKNEPDLEKDKSTTRSTAGAAPGPDKAENQKDLTCKYCEKVLGSSSSLDRHLLVHSGERPFRCKMCDLTFNTNGNMHRHMRSHKQNHDSDSEDSEVSGSGTRASAPRMPNTRKRRLEYNNNDKTTNGSGGNSADDEQTPGGKRKSKNINNNVINNCVNAQRLICPVCDREDFVSLNVFELHMEEAHPDFQVKCSSCNQCFKNHRVLNLHRFMVHHTERKDSPNKKVTADSVSGFKDCTFIDFSSQKFPQIAKTVCEQSVHKSVTEQAFSCDQCSRDFPCESALDIHRKSCVATSSGESEDYAKRRRESSSTDEDVRRDDFFANLDLQNKSPNYTATPRPMADARKAGAPNEYYAFSKDTIRPLVDNSKDLADIQSMISVTSVGGLFEPLTHKSHEVASLTSDHGSRGNDDHEEVQDVFAAEFRKMKLRGEFPCRLCTAIFPNLRALKGHNRVHLSGNGPGPYRCNMCPQSSLDKAALVRHMRTHNGDRPYECAVCNYAFTTKANCERHLRNRHSKVTREEVKRAIIYHPSEDPNNDEVNSKLNISREDIKRSLIFSTPESEHREDAERQNFDTPVSHFPREATVAFKDRNLTIPLPRDLSIVVPQPREILRPHCSVDPVCHIIPKPAEELAQPRLKVKGFGQLTQIPEFSESDAEREPDSDEDMERAEEAYPGKSVNYACEVPMDLSTGEYQDDVLDLSKKKIEKVEENPISDAEVDNFLPKTIEYESNSSTAPNIFEKTQQLFLAQQQLLKGAHLQKLDPAASFYANQLSQLYRAGTAFPGLGIPPAFPLNPYFLQHAPFLSPPTNPKELAEMKERIQKEIIRGLQLSGGGLVGMDQRNIVNNMALATERLQAFHQQAMSNVASPDMRPHTPIPFIKTEEDVKPPLHINTDSPTSAAPFSNPMMSSPKIQKKEVISNHSPNSVKMVIKNGVLMPKQKQRRYRTERPFSCEHCSARFTLRSNMERHIKQQHPQFWSQRQRSNIGLPRKNPVSLVPQNITVPSLNYENRLNYIKNITPNSEPSNNNSNSGEEKDASSNNAGNLPVNKTYSMISDQVKYAILAQQLKSHSVYTQPKIVQNKTEPIAEIEEEDEDDALIIDEEESVDDKSQVVKDLQSKSASENVQPQQTDSNLMAKKVAQEILIGVSAKTQQPDISKDFDWKIAGSLISKNPQHHTAQNLGIPTFVSQIGQNGEADVEQSESNTNKDSKQEEGDLVSVSRLLDNAVTQIPFGKYFKNDYVANTEVQPRNDSSMQHPGEGSEEDEEGLVASSGSTSEGNNSGSDENRSESENNTQVPQKKKSAYSLAPNRVSCPYCHRKFPWSSSLRRHILTHTGQKPYKCLFCPLLFTTKSNCDRHLLRKHGNQIQQAQLNAAAPVTNVANNDTTPNSVSIPGLENQGFMMRNVPERPYKCASCPSSTFSTLSNLKKHMSSKHGIQIDESRPGSPKMDESNQSPIESGDEPHLTSDDEKKYNDTEVDSFVGKAAKESGVGRTEWDSQISTSKYSPSYLQDVPSNMQNSDLPFKCHLCDQSYAERQDALDHIKDVHSSEYELLMSKGSLETSAPFGEELGSSTPDRGHRSEGGDEQGEENGEQLRGKFPDYANRKVVCAFCMRRFWSAEDLRRHMRTHTGERPFSCNVCQRRFTLKHSMLRHRKKHVDSLSCEDLSTASGDEETASPSSSSQNYSKSTNSTFSPLNFSYASSTNTSTSTPKNSHLTLNGYQMAINKNLSPEVPSNVNNNNSPPSQSYEGQVKVHNIKRDDNAGTDDQENESGNDLIGNLLGIDKRVINKLLSSPDEAAKLLGMNK